MAINKKFIHFKTFENFNSKKLSANEENNKYTLGVDGEIQTGSPEILYQSICYIKDIKKQWTHGSLYNCSDNVDFATDLTGVLEATPEEFTFRPSAGDKSIRDESAVIRRIKGNTSVWAQYIKNPNFSDGTTNWGASNGTLTVNESGGVRFIHTGVSSQHISQNVGSIPKGHKILIVIDYQRSSDATKNILFYLQRANVGGFDRKNIYSISSAQRRVDYAIITTTDDIPQVLIYPFIGGAIDEYTDIYSVNIFDLTALYESGNEPTTLEEFKKTYPESYYPYCVPEIRSMRATGIETIGANAFDKDSVVGGLINDDGSVTLNDAYSVARIEVVPSTKYHLQHVANSYLGIANAQCYTYAFYDSNDTFIVGGYMGDNITFQRSMTGDVTTPMNARYMRVRVDNSYLVACRVIISHTYIPEEATYFKSVRMFPEIVKYFPDGMHGIGDAFDEINEVNAIQRLDIRAYEEGDYDNTNVKTDGSNTVYILEEPIITPITEPLQLDYKVADFGTEMMLHDLPSSPFRADIVYKFNAEGRIRDNARNIERLENSTKGTYSKPNDGIPKSDLSSEVQQSLEKANTAVQVQGPDEIWYTTIDGNVTYGTFYYNGEDYYVSNTYSNGIGIMKFKYPITYILDSAFEDNSTLLSIILPEGVVSIGSYSFSNTPLRSVDLPPSCTTIGDYAFSECPNLKNIDLSNITIFGEHAFHRTLLQSVKFSRSVFELPIGVFQWCTGLKNIILPNELEIIQAAAFSGTAISSIIIPKTVTNIEDQAFADCPVLKEIYFQSEVCPEIGDRIFDINISDRKIYVPASALNTYKTTWSQYSDNILAYIDSNNLKTINGTSLIGTGDISIQTSGTVDLSGYYTKTEIDTKGYLTSIPSEYITETELAAKKYATTTALNNKQDKLVSGTNIKTINGTSLLGSGNLSITTGEENVQSDWLENNSTDAYIKNRTHYITGTKITSAGTYTVSGSQIYFDGNIYNLELGVKTTLKSGPYVYATLTTATSLKIEDTGAYTVAYPVIAITSIKKLDDVFISDNIVRNDSLKTINGESIVGSGNIEITSGASGTITEVQANGTSISTSGVANIPAASTSVYGVTKLSSSTSSTSTTLAATASAVKSAYDLANGKQNKLTSGTNIMTARGQSILTSGDLFNSTIISTNVAGTQPMFVGNCYIYSLSQTTTKTFVLNSPNSFWNDSINIIINSNAAITFSTTSATPILWVNGATPTFDSDKTYEISFRYTPMGWLGVAVAFHSA